MWGIKVKKYKDKYQVSISRVNTPDFVLYLNDPVSFIRYMENKTSKDLDKIITNYNRKEKLLKISKSEFIKTFFINQNPN